ncbi:MAG: hypothetical protein K2P40_05650 [Lachnospiraceae bacterium]|nr:hypothetical protein [Lachnospiraceae bacterium]
MAMEIINNYSSHAENYADTTKKSNSNAVTEGRINTATNSRDNVQQYYEQLCKKFSRMSINTSGQITSSSKNNIVLNLSNDCLKKMAGDPDFAKKIENDIAGIPAAHEQMFAKAKSDGIEIQGFSVRINADGSIQCSCSGSTRTSGSNHNASVLNTEKRQMEKRQTEKRQKKELEKEREERNALEEKAKKRAEKKAAERQAEKKEVGDAGNEMSEYTISVTGMDIRAVTEKMIAAVSGISVPTGASFDIKA